MSPSIEKPYAGIFVKNFFAGMKAKQADVDFLSMPRNETSRLGTIFKYLLFFFRSYRYLRTKYDVVHLHFPYPLICWTFFYKIIHPSTKVVITFHGTDVKSHFTHRLSRAIGRFLMRHVDSVCAVGFELGEEVRHKLGIRDPLIISAGIDPNVFNTNGKVDKRYDLIYVGSLSVRKGILEFVEFLTHTDNSLSICFVGIGPLKNYIEKVGFKHRISFFNSLSQPEIADQLRSAKFLILPSHWEGFGLVVSEAMFCGTPVLGSDVIGINAQVEHGLNGFLFEAKNISKMGYCINRAINLGEDDYQSLVQYSLKSNRQHELNKVLNQYISIYTGKR